MSCQTTKQRLYSKSNECFSASIGPLLFGTWAFNCIHIIILGNYDLCSFTGLLWPIGHSKRANRVQICIIYENLSWHASQRAIRTHYTHVIMIIRATCFPSAPGVVRLDRGLCTDRVCARRPEKIKIKIVHLR